MDLFFLDTDEDVLPPLHASPQIKRPSRSGEIRAHNIVLRLRAGEKPAGFPSLKAVDADVILKQAWDHRDCSTLSNKGTGMLDCG